MLEPTGSDIVNCVSRGKSQVHRFVHLNFKLSSSIYAKKYFLTQLFECRNHVRVIQPMQNGKLYICGTNAHNPKDYVIYVSHLIFD